MNKFVKCILAVIVILILTGAFLFFGNPVSEFLVKRNAEKYIAENYKAYDYIVESVNYDFKTGNYYANISSPSSIDSSFTLYAGANGKIGFDTYESAVEGKWNTAGRINDEYRLKVEKALENEEFDYECNIGFGDIEFTQSDAPADASVPEYAISTSSLELDKNYDVNEFGKKAGHITVYIYNEDVSIEKLSEILLSFKKAADSENLDFYVIDCVLEYPNGDDEALWRDDRVEVMGFLYSEIYSGGLSKRVQQSNEKARAYYEAQNAEKEVF